MIKTPENQVKAALQSPKLDTSDFILLAVDYMEKVNKPKNPKIQSQINEIRKLYTNMNFNEAIKQIFHSFQEHTPKMHPEIATLMRDMQNKLEDNPMENESRRFYETRLAAMLSNHLQQSGDYKSVEKLMAVMKDFHIEPYLHRAGRHLPEKVNSIEDANHVMMQILALNDNIERELKVNSPNYNKKDRANRNAVEYDKHLDKLVEPESRNPGIMRGLSPNFYNLVSNVSKQNRIPDIYKINIHKPQGYSKENKNVPFAGSVSGTSFTTMVLLDAYVKKHKGEPNLQKEINDILRAFVTLYISEGFHSLGEMMDVINEPHIQKIFRDNNIKLEFTFPEKEMKKAFKEAQQYAKTQGQKKALHEELKVKRPSVPDHTEQKPKVIIEEKKNVNIEEHKLAKVQQQALLKQKLNDAKTLDQIIEILNAHKDRKGVMLSAAGIILSVDEQIKAIQQLRNNQPIQEGSKVTSNYDLEAKVKRLVEAEKLAKAIIKAQAPNAKVEPPGRDPVKIAPKAQNIVPKLQLNEENLVIDLPMPPKAPQAKPQEVIIPKLKLKEENLVIDLPMPQMLPKAPQAQPQKDPVKLAIAKINATQTWAINQYDKRYQWLDPLLKKLEALDKQPNSESKIKIFEQLVTMTYCSAALDKSGFNAKRVTHDIIRDILHKEPPVIANPIKVEQPELSQQKSPERKDFLKPKNNR